MRRGMCALAGALLLLGIGACGPQTPTADDAYPAPIVPTPIDDQDAYPAPIEPTPIDPEGAYPGPVEPTPTHGEVASPAPINPTPLY